MFKHWMKATAVAVLLGVSVLGCGAQEEAAVSTQAEARYEKISDTLYVDDAAVRVNDDQAGDAKQIKDQVENLVLRVLHASYQGRIGTVDGDFIKAPGLEAELGARIAYLAQKYDDAEFANTAAYLRINHFDIQDDAAKVICDVAIKDPETGDVKVENHEGYVFVKDGDHWCLINDIVDTGRGGAKVLEALVENTNPTDWKTTYSYENLKRSDYEDAPDFVAFLSDDGITADPEKVSADAQ
ncbi:MAG: hypothetical protein Q4C56_00580 [Peptococcaceae bacterium]|nr:hypothetical protein [Peptococcaceae bacterium]